MELLNLIPLVVLMTLHTTAYGQFNTVKKIEIFPQVQIDTTIESPKKNISLITPIDSARFIVVEKRANALVSMPLSHPIINSNFGNRIDPLTGKENFHQGIDFKSSGDSVMVIMPGKVKKVAYSRGLGNYIEVEHGDFKTTYGHLSFIMVREKMKLNAGTVIGITGSTGRSTGEHLHFAIKHEDKIIDPIPFLDIIYRTLEINARKRTAGVYKN